MLCERCELALSARRRVRGLLGRDALAPDEGLWIEPASSIHMWFMRFAIDVVYVARDGAVLKVVHAIKPWRLSACRGAHVALELAAGAAERCGVRAGDYVTLER